MKDYRKSWLSLVLLPLFLLAALGSGLIDNLRTYVLYPDGKVERGPLVTPNPDDPNKFDRGIVNEEGHWEGVVETYTKEGLLVSKTEYSAGLRQGLEVFYDKNGNPTSCYIIFSLPISVESEINTLVAFELREKTPCPPGDSSAQLVMKHDYHWLTNSYASYYEALETRGAWVIHFMAQEGFTSEKTQAFLEALQAEINAANPTRVNFSTIYSNALKTVRETEAYDLFYEAYQGLQASYRADTMLGWPLRLAILDRYRDNLSLTFDILENSYSYYLIQLQSYGASLSDIERVVNEIDVRLDIMNQTEPLDVNHTLFPFRIDDRLAAALTDMSEDEFEFGTAITALMIEGSMVNSWADPLRTAVHDATFGEPFSPLVSINPGVGGQVRVGDAQTPCDKVCLNFFATGDQITLTAIPNAGFQFFGWEGQCEEAAFSCSFEASTLHPVLAHFIPIGNIRYLLEITKAGAGNGTVVSTSPAGIDCGTDCSEEYNQDQVVTLKATPAAGSSFVGWGGPCAGAGVCQVTMNAAKTVTATFNLAPPFNDVPASSWAYGYIHAIRDAGITNGCGSNNYCPSNNVTRDQMAAFLIRAIEGDPGSDLCAAGSPFSDVSAGAWYCSHVKRLVELAITAGCGKDQYCPGNQVTREQMAAFIVRSVAGEPPQNYCGDVAPFSDVSSSSWSCGYIKKLVELGITQGFPGNEYRPSANVNREQMAAFLARAFLDME